MTGCWPSKQESLEMTNFASSVVSAGGSLDISKLVDPHAPSGMVFSHDQTPPIDSSPIVTPSPLVQHESKDPSPPVLLVLASVLDVCS